MKKLNYITYWIIILPIVAVILTSSILTYEFISYENKKLVEEIEDTKKKHIKEIKNRIKNRINRTITLIQTQVELNKIEEKKDIKNIVNIAYETMSQIYKQYQDKPKEFILEKIKKNLREQRFYANLSGYYFLIDLKDKVIMQPQTPSHEGKILTKLQDVEGKYFIQEFRNIALTKESGFITWHWHKPQTNKVGEKLGYIKLFKPLGVYIGTARYKEDINKKIKKQILSIIDSIRFKKDEYIFAINSKGTTLSHINKAFVGKKYEELSQIEKKVVNIVLKKAINKNGSFLNYTPTSHNISKNLSEKISFVKKVPNFDLIIGTGQYTLTIQEELERKKSELEKEVRVTKNKIIIISTIISLFLILILIFISRKIDTQFNIYEKELLKNNLKLKKLNESLESKVKKQVLEIRRADDILNQQSKLASMGEMIGNIAHQWRQPLSTICTIASGTKFEDELNTLNKEKLYKNLDSIVSNTKHLSQTIEDFRSFFKKDKVKKSFFVKDIIKKVINLMSASFKNKEIIIEVDIKENIKICALENELTQAILNILNNSKDALVEKNLDIKIIKIKSYIKDEKVYIEILDNGGGIKKDIIDKIFEPYFTTKFQAQGTGIGLYMTRTIIVNHIQGQIDVKNINFKYKDKTYKGTLMRIIIDNK